MISPYIGSPPQFINLLNNLLDYAISIRSSQFVVAVVPLLRSLAAFLLLRTFVRYIFGSPPRTSQFNSQVEQPPAVESTAEAPLPVKPHLLEVIIDSCRGDSDWFNRVMRGLAIQRQQATSQGKVEMSIYLVNRRAGPSMTESYTALCGAWAVATGDPDHKDITFEVRVDEEECIFRDERGSVDEEMCPTGSNAPVQAFPPAEFLDIGEKSHITEFHWKGPLFSLPETLRLPYLPHTPNLATLTLTGCDIAIDDFVGILQHCPNLGTVDVDRIGTNASILDATLPRKTRSPSPHRLTKLTVTSTIDTHQLFTSVEWERLSHLSLILSSGETIGDLKIPWNRLKQLHLDCWIGPNEVRVIHSKVNEKTQVKICQSTRRYQTTTKLAGRIGNLRLAQ